MSFLNMNPRKLFNDLTRATAESNQGIVLNEEQEGVITIFSANANSKRSPSIVLNKRRTIIVFDLPKSNTQCKNGNSERNSSLTTASEPSCQEAVSRTDSSCILTVSSLTGKKRKFEVTEKLNGIDCST